MRSMPARSLGKVDSVGNCGHGPTVTNVFARSPSEAAFVVGVHADIIWQLALRCAKVASCIENL